jgi:DNA gyrase subunit A
MRLSRLTGLEREKLATEYGALCDLIGELEAILASKELLDEVIVTELDEIRERFGDARRTEIVEAEGDISIEDLVPDEEVVVTVSHAGYVKRVPLSEYRAQGRGGKGLRAMDTRDQDFVSWVFVVNAHAHVLFLSDKGKAYLKKVYQIPETSRAARGRAVVNLVGMESDERVAAILPIREFVEDGYLLTCTRRGRVKRTNLSAYENIRQTGIIGVAIGEGDGLLTARIVTPGQHVLIGTSRGMSIRFPVEDVRGMGRDSMGVKGIDLREGDFVIGMDIIEEDSDQQVLTVSANGYGKRTKVAEWRTQNRGGKGIIGMDTSERNGALVKLRLVSPDDQLMVITNGGQVIRTRVGEIRETGRNTQGVRVIRLREAEQVVDVEPVAEGEEGTESAIAEPEKPQVN